MSYYLGLPDVSCCCGFEDDYHRSEIASLDHVHQIRFHLVRQNIGSGGECQVFPLQSYHFFAFHTLFITSWSLNLARTQGEED